VAIKRRHAMLILLPRYFPTKIGLAPAKALKRFNKTENLGKKWEERWTGWFLKSLLWALSKAFDLSENFRENIKDFEAKYVFRAERSSIVASVTFKDGAMEVQKWSQDDHPNVTVVFKDADALKRYLFSLFSGEQDILQLILSNDVQLDGNWNYVHKFLFMVNDLRRRLTFLK
jgi:hypothetical protein